MPAQFGALNRWVGRDRSIRHLAVQFQATVPANGEASYNLTASAPGAPTITVEESGPMRVVIRAEMPAVYNDLDGNGDVLGAGEYHRHGYAVRIYAYARKPYVKIDYQLQNSAKGPALTPPPPDTYTCAPGKKCGFADPLYFEELRLDFGQKFLAGGQPADCFHDEALALGELNVRPQWMAQYKHQPD